MSDIGREQRERWQRRIEETQRTRDNTVSCFVGVVLGLIVILLLHDSGLLAAIAMSNVACLAALLVALIGFAILLEAWEA